MSAVEAQPVGAEPAVTAAYCNEVRLRGRMSAPAESRALPSGDTVVTFRVIVERDTADRPRQRVDTIDCAAWTPHTQRSARTWQPGDVVEVTGALRRRFRRGAAGPTSRVEVEVFRARRVR
ncbi:MAG TPA: single-stranded DNA-binding protein [Nocardioidaceae bacterium]|nr:single-stranded DNA-binding protein [Nocardioidaceae bacterium]